MSYVDAREEIRNDVDALLQKASEMHYLIATSDLSLAQQSMEGNKTAYDGSALLLEQVMALKWPAVNPAWLRDLWIDLLEVPSSDDVRRACEVGLYRDPAHDPSVVASDYASSVVRAAIGEAAYNARWSDDANTLWEISYDVKYTDQTKAVEVLARDMSRPARGK